MFAPAATPRQEHAPTAAVQPFSGAVLSGPVLVLPRRHVGVEHPVRRAVTEGNWASQNKPSADRVEGRHRDRCQLCLGQQQRKTLANFSEGEVALQPRANER